jgi:hypothetical protein
MLWLLQLQGIDPGTHCIGDYVGPRAGLDILEKRKIFSPCWESNPDSQAVRCLAAILTELSKLLYIISIVNENSQFKYTLTLVCWWMYNIMYDFNLQ